MGQASKSSGAPSLGYIARATAVVIGLWALANVVWLGRDLFFIAFLAILFASFLSIAVRPLERLRIPRLVAAPVVFLIWLGSLAGLVALVWPLMQEQLGMLRQQLPDAISKLLSWIEGSLTAINSEIGEPSETGDGTDFGEQFHDGIARLAQRLVSGALPIVGTVFGALGGVLVILFAGLYLAIESRLFLRGLLSLMPVSARPRVQSALERAGHDLQRWVLGTGIAMVLVGTLTSVGLLALGIPAPFALGVLAGLLEFIPFFGPIIASVPGIALALITSPLHALWVMLMYIVVQQLESNLISPLVMKGVVKLPPALVLLFQLLMTILFGFIGLLVAVPLLATVIVMVKRLYVQPMAAATEPDARPS